MQIYKDKKVLITGHTGFKGSWLALRLCRTGAKVVGYALGAPTSPSHYELLSPDCFSIIGDIRDGDKLEKVIEQEQPEIIFHLAAQPLVRQSYQEPAETFSTNIMGTVNLLNACRKFSAVRAIVVITSDKCYENQELERGYREDDAMGGHDPYSASKGCAEIVTSSYRRSFFPISKYGKEHTTLLASARAGNVIGGGDWAQDRLIPDIVRAASKNETVFIRNPNAIRPWQHVLEPLSGYLMLGQKLLEGNIEFAQGWNFGPSEGDELTVETMVEQLQRHWDRIVYQRSEE
ncbi:MAG: CDP-glucose 4,6-dehydratase, partial [Planctomycetota bacterium]